MDLMALISQVFKPAADLIDNLHTSKEEKLQQKAVLLQIQTEFLAKGLEFEKDQLKARAAIIEAEAKSGNWLTSSWRPVTMYVFLFMLVSYWFGWVDPTARITPELLDKIFTLLQIGLGGYIVSRGVEKVVPATMQAMKKKEQT